MVIMRYWVVFLVERIYMNKNSQKLNALMSIKRVNKNGHIYDNLFVDIPSDEGSISFQVKLAFANPKLLYKIKKQLEKEGK